MLQFLRPLLPPAIPPLLISRFSRSHLPPDLRCRAVPSDLLFRYLALAVATASRYTLKDLRRQLLFTEPQHRQAVQRFEEAQAMLTEPSVR